MPVDVKLLPSQSSFSSMPVSAGSSSREAKSRPQAPQRTVRPSYSTSGLYIEWGRLFRQMTGVVGIASVVALWLFAAYLTVLLRHV
jgi:hypothetical protein